MTKPVYPWHSEEYFQDRAPILKKLMDQIDPEWDKFMTGKLTMAEYQAIIVPFINQYTKKIDPVWIKHKAS